MNKNLKISLIAVLCIVICGFIVSFKSFKLFNNFNRQNNVATSQEVSGWIGETIDQKIMQLESSVAYLDKSTVESLKRFGARYFAYAHKENGEWSIKWKQLGGFSKEQIHEEVKKLEFDKLSLSQRAWFLNSNNQPIFVSPVELANSLQLKSGFLIFGLDDTFFGFLKAKDEKIALVNKALAPIHQGLPKNILEDKTLFNQKDLGLGSLLVEQGGETRTLTSYFSPTSQLFIVHQQEIAGGSYLASSYFTYFLLASLLMALLFFFFTNIPAARLSNRKSGRAPTFADQLIGDLAQRAGILRAKIMAKRVKKTSMTDSLETMNAESDHDEIIADFGEFVEEILSAEQGKLKKRGIALKTQFAEKARVQITPPYIRDFLKRLIGNSVTVLENHKNKEIQVQLVEQTDSYQLIYLDTRMENFPTGEESSLLLQTEGSMVGIDGIIAYASWLFGSDLNVAKNGFCLSLNIPKGQVAETVLKNAGFEEIDQEVQRIEINEDSLDPDIMESLNSIENFQFTPKPAKVAHTSVSEDMDANFKQGSLDEIIESFSLKELKFNETQPKSIEAQEKTEETLDETSVSTDERGLFEFNSGKVKIKIRTPKKRNMDVDG